MVFSKIQQLNYGYFGFGIIEIGINPLSTNYSIIRKEYTILFISSLISFTFCSNL
nr:MAG TPA: hypothetical protein [Bacteriophage sp.]